MQPFSSTECSGKSLLKKTAAEMVLGIRRGDFTAVTLIELALERAEKVQAHLNPFTVIDRQAAIEAAVLVDARRVTGEMLPPLAGVPVVIKDMTPTERLPTTMGSWTTGPGRTDVDAIIVARLRAAGAIVVAKSTTSEFAFSSFTRSVRYGITRNPWNPQATPGGSSGGSAVAVATSVSPFAEGSDMGGSIRIPAAACGTVGFKPSLGRIPMTILPTPIDTISHFGPLAACVSDAISFTAATAGPSDHDLLSQITAFNIDACAPAQLKGLHFALSVDLGYCEVSDDVRSCVLSAVDKLRAQQAVVDEVPMSWSRAAMDSWLVKWAALLTMFPSGHGSENHARMDPALVELIERAETITAGDLKRTEFVQAEMAADIAAIFGNYDAFICPTIAVTAPSADATDSEFEVTLENGNLRAFDMTHPFNMLPTYPAISVPVGLASDGLPVGLQIVGPRYRDERLLSIAGAVEAALGRMPPIPFCWECP